MLWQAFLLVVALVAANAVLPLIQLNPSASQSATQSLGVPQNAPATRAATSPTPGSEYLGNTPKNAAMQAATGKEQAQAMEAAWRAWLAQNDISASSIAIGEAGQILHTADFGGRSATHPYPVVDLSKSITAICLNKVLAQKGLRWSTRLGDIAEQMNAVHVPPSPNTVDLTLGELATHTAGLAPDLGVGDLTGLTNALGVHRPLAFAALGKTGTQGERGRYFYSNTNYAVLGTVIEALTGEPYSQACLTRTLAPAGAAATASLSGPLGVLSSFGGWSISAADYARFAMHWFAPDQPYVIDPREAAFDKGAGGYGLGMSMTGIGPDTQIQHTGRLCPADSGDGFGALVAGNVSGLIYVVNFTQCIEIDRYAALIDALDRAAR